MKSIIYSTLIILLCCFTAAAQNPTQLKAIKAQMQAKLDSLQRANGFPGATFAAVLPNGHKITIATGMADSARGIPMRPDNRMLSGSNGKTLFAASAMVLAEQGLYSLDDKIEKYIGQEPWFSRIPNAKSITMRMLLNHTSGLEEYYQLGDFMQKLKENPARSWAPSETFAYIFDRKPLFEAGKGWGYADTNYILFGYILERISGKKMYELAKKLVIEPYHLNDTEPSVKRKYARFAVGYSKANGPFPFEGAMIRNGELVFNPQFEWMGGGFVSSASDLATWAKAMYHFKAIPAAKREEMRQGVPAYTGKNHLYGLGIQIRPGGFAGNGYGHSGWFPGYISDGQYFPDLDVAMGIQFNTDNGQLLKRSTHDYMLDMARIISAVTNVPN
ncbi:beta-lactamase family protein [Pontibacter sp. FD36]|uniref:serine hydrolase domain-containing protein n=1 Tax=Pontibacter sp. FD36 TaxID=2789860 RepID=UPI0018AB6582|nr:serine hydrolase domain-containing protein [Pontibacter sp. FD36]MBF8964068.1 beta-lactamase family protein [Pontibacter sp. FD36]